MSTGPLAIYVSVFWDRKYVGGFNFHALLEPQGGLPHAPWHLHRSVLSLQATLLDHFQWLTWKPWNLHYMTYRRDYNRISIMFWNVLSLRSPGYTGILSDICRSTSAHPRPCDVGTAEPAFALSGEAKDAQP